MANSYWRCYLLSFFLLNLLQGVLPALYPTQPVANTVFYCGDSALITWIDTRRRPRIADIGSLSIKLYTNDDDYVATLADGVNPVSFGTLVAIPMDLRNDTLYLLRFSGPGLIEDVWTADFTILSDASNYDILHTPHRSAKSNDPIVATSTASRGVDSKSPVKSLLAPTPTSSTQQQPNRTEIMAPVSTINADPWDAPPRGNGAIHSRADQLEKAKFRLLFIVWPAIFGLSMAL